MSSFMGIVTIALLISNVQFKIKTNFQLTLYIKLDDFEAFIG